MNNNSQNNLYRVFLIGFFLILVLPLLNIQPLFSPPAWGKAISFRFIVSILIFLFLYQIISEKIKVKLPDRKSKVFFPFWLLIILAGIYLLSTILSLNPHYSFWESPYRAGGSLNFILYIIFAILTFLLVKEKDWQKIWNVVFLVGALVCLIAFFQRLELFSDVLIPRTERAIATMGSAILLALYLLLLTFLSLSFGIKTKGKKRLFCLFCFGFFALTLFLTGGRAGFLGFGVGFLFFIFLYPSKKSREIKISALAILVLLILGAFWLNNQPALLQNLKENKVFGAPFNRIWSTVQPLLDIKELSFNKITSDNRFSAWKISWEALKERPIFGYGPENFAIAFDKHYNPSLPGFKGQDWWDRAHNFIFDIGVTAGIPALIIYLALFGALFWKLQTLKRADNNAKKTPKVIYHGVQATFIGYLVANLFSFDCFSTYLIFFLLVGYSLFLISQNQPEVISINPKNQYNKTVSKKPLWKSVLIFGLFCLLIWFLWVGVLKPFKINKEINLANYYTTRNDKCQKAIGKMEEILPSHSIIDSYLRLSYIDIITNCQKQSSELRLKLTPKLTQILKEAVELRPYYTRSWWFLGISTNFLINYKDKYSGLDIEELKKQANASFEKAHQLSPKRWVILNSWVATDLLTGEYQRAKEKTKECLDLNPNHRECWWQKGLANIALGQTDQGWEDIKKAEENGFNFWDMESSLLQLTQAYNKGLVLLSEKEKQKAYQELVKIYQRLIYHNRNNFQYHASLAYIYKELGDYEKAAQEAIKVFALSPESKPSIKEFLFSLPLTPGSYRGFVEFYKKLIKESPKNPQYHSSLAFVYAQIGEYEKARQEAMIVLELSPGSKADVEEFLRTLPLK